MKVNKSLKKDQRARRALSVILIEMAAFSGQSAEQLCCQARQAQEVTRDRKGQSYSGSGHLDLVLLS